MTGNEQLILETAIPEVKVKKESSKSPVKVTQEAMEASNSKVSQVVMHTREAKDDQDEVVEEITEEGTVSSELPNPVNQDLFVKEKNPFEAEKCRIEILNLPLGYDNEQELVDIFSKHGKVLKVEFKTLKCVHGFIQFQSQPEMLLALKAEDRREMPQGFKLNLVDEYKRNEERKAIKTATIVAEKKRNIDNSKRNVRDRDRDRNPKPKPSSRKRSLSPVSSYSRRDSIPKRAAPKGPFDILIIGLGDVLNSFVEAVEDKCLEMRFRPDIAYLDYRDDVKGRIVDFQRDASLGCFAVLFCERKREDSRNVSMQLFSIQGTRDFENLSQSEAFSMLNKERQTRHSVQTMLPSTMNPPQPLLPVQNPLMMALGGQNLDPQRLLSLANSLPQPPLQQAYPVQSYPSYQQNYAPVQPLPQYSYPAVNQAPAQNVGNLLSQLSSVQDMLKRSNNQGQR